MEENPFRIVRFSRISAGPPTSGREGGEHSREEERGRGVTRASPKRRGALRTGPAAQGRARVRGKGIAGEAGAGDRSGHPRAPVVQEGLKVGGTSDGGVAVEEDLELGREKEREEMSTAELRRKLEGVRLKLGGAPRPSISELRKLPEEEDGEDQWQEDALRSGSAEDVKGLTSGSSLKRKKAVEDSRGSTTKNVSEQLVRQAQQLAAGKARKSEDERSRSESRGGERAELLALLNQAAKKTSKGDREDRDPPRRSGDSGHSKKKKKKKRNKKDKKKRRRRRLVNGVIISSSGSSYSSEETSRSERSLSEGGFRSAAPQEIQSSAGIRPQAPSSASTRCLGPGGFSRDDRELIDGHYRWSEADNLLSAPHQASLWTVQRPYERHCTDGKGAGHDPSGCHRPGMRHAGGALPCSTSSTDGPIVGPGGATSR